MYECDGGNEEVVSNLIDDGDNVEEKNENGKKKIMEDESEGKVGVDKILLENGDGIKKN
jgi:hypothetical protein